MIPSESPNDTSEVVVISSKEFLDNQKTNSNEYQENKISSYRAKSSLNNAIENHLGLNMYPN